MNLVMLAGSDAAVVGIGSAIDLTRNSIKTRIKKMVSEGLIQQFIVCNFCYS
jgi:predicted transcriptional regulator